MPVIAVGSVIPKRSRVLTKCAEKMQQPIQKTHKSCNSFEFHAGFVPPVKSHNDKVNLEKVEHFINSIV